MKPQTPVEERIAILRPLLILGIVYVHTGGVGDAIAWEWANPFEYLLAVGRNGLFRAGVPMLTLISGYLLFRASLDQAPLKMFGKKARTLLVPFLVFNLGFIALMYPIEAATGFGHRVSLIDVDTEGWLTRLFALQGSPFNYPLYFLRDMIVLIMLAPLFGVFLRKAPLIGLAIVSAVFFFGLDGYLILRGTSAILFYIGGMAAIYRWNLQALDRFAPACAVLGVFACLAFIAMRGQDATWLALTLPLLLWPAASLLHGTRLAQWALKYNKYSFFVFVSHAPLMFLGWEFVLRYARFIPFPVYYVFAPLLTVAVLVGLYRVGMRMAPAVFNVMIGCRDRKVGSAAPAAGVLGSAYRV